MNHSRPVGWVSTYLPYGHPVKIAKYPGDVTNCYLNDYSTGNRPSNVTHSTKIHWNFITDGLA